MTHRPIAPALIIMLALSAAFLVTADGMTARGIALTSAFIAGIILGIKAPVDAIIEVADVGGDSDV